MAALGADPLGPECSARKEQRAEQGRLTREEAEAVALSVASDYMRLSTSATLAQVFPLFAADATYLSESLGSSWQGLDAVRGMMEGFFAKFPDVRWEVTVMRVVEGCEPRPAAVRVAVEFVRRWTDEAGEQRVRSGREWIHVDPAAGRIVHVRVAPLDAA